MDSRSVKARKENPLGRRCIKRLPIFKVVPRVLGSGGERLKKQNVHVLLKVEVVVPSIRPSPRAVTSPKTDSNGGLRKGPKRKDTLSECKGFVLMCRGAFQNESMSQKLDSGKVFLRPSDVVL